MNTPRFLLGAVAWAGSLFVVLSGGCDDSSSPAPQDDRAPIGKADAAQGSCLVDDADVCGDISPDGCFCDDQCTVFGDCCGDKATVCDGEPPAACADLDPAEPECEARDDCAPFLLAACPQCQGGELICIDITPTQVPCDTLDASDPADEQHCLERADCGLILVPACPICDGGVIECIPVEPPDVACEDLSADVPEERATCEDRTDCHIVLEPACPVCDGGVDVCTSIL